MARVAAGARKLIATVRLPSEVSNEGIRFRSAVGDTSFESRNSGRFVLLLLGLIFRTKPAFQRKGVLKRIKHRQRHYLAVS